MNWSGYAYDPQNSLLMVNANNVPSKMGVIPADKYWGEVEKNTGDADYTRQSGGPYGLFRTFLFAKAHHLPCAPPPWGTLTAVDMVTGTFRWQVPLGSLSPGNSAVPLGAPSLGGPMVTAGGLVFIAGTMIDPSRIRRGDWQRNMEVSTSYQRRGDSDDLPDAETRKAVCRYCCRRAQPFHSRTAERLDCGVHSALGGSGTLRAGGNV